MSAVLIPSKRYNDTELENGILAMYYDGASVKSISKAIDRSYDVTQVKIRRLRIKYGLPARRQSPKTLKCLSEDLDVIAELSVDMSVRQLAIKFACSRDLMRKFLEINGLRVATPTNDIPIMSLDYLKKGGWIDIEGKTIITIGRIGRFYLDPI